MSLLRSARVLTRPALNLFSHARAPLAAAPVRSMSGGLSTPLPAKLEEVVAGEVAGRQLEELEYELEGLGGFNDAPAEGAFGTLAAPVRIYSAFHSRIVGCKGGDDSKHRLSWFELKAGPKHVCMECGQVFQLVTAQAEEGAQQAAHAH